MSELMELYFKEELEASRTEGRKEGKVEIIQEMLKDNMSIDKIVQYTDMDIKYILKIQSNMLEKGQL